MKFNFFFENNLSCFENQVFLRFIFQKFAVNFPLDTVPGIFGFLPKLAELIDSNSDYHDHRLAQFKSPN